MVRFFGALSRRRIAETAAVGLLLCLHAWLAISSGRGKSAAFDEIAHLGGGYLQWTAGDYRFNAESGALLQRWAAWPLLAFDLGVPPAGHPARRGANVWILGRELLYGQGPGAEALLQAGRGMIVLLSLALGSLVYAWSRARYGSGGGLLSLVLYALSPTMLAHARLVTADLAACLFFLLATGALWRLLLRVTPARLAGTALAVSGLLLSKMSGVLILPIAAILILLRLVRWRPAGAQPCAAGAQPCAAGAQPCAAGAQPCAPTIELAFGSTRFEIVPLRHQVLVIGALALAVTLVVFGAVWTAYGWRFSAQPDSPPEGSRFLHSFDSLLARDNPANDSPARESLTSWALGAARDARLLPEAYLWGLAYTFDTTRERDAFLRGRTSRTGWWWFFPYAVAIKTPLALFGLLGLAAAAARRPATTRSSNAPLWVLITVYSLVAIASHINIGHRHMLPIYPALFIFAGAAARRYKPWLAALALLCLSSFAWESRSIRPHYLSYFNQLVGGPTNGYRHLVDSSLDWGQDLPGLADFLDDLRTAEGESTVYVAYFGAAPPAYHGIDARWLYSFFAVADPSLPPLPLTGGRYFISATLLQSMHIELPGPWDAEHEKQYRQQREQVAQLARGEAPAVTFPSGGTFDRARLFRSFHRLRSARLYAFLRRREPDARIGYSIHVYRLSDADIEQALNAPLDDPKPNPPELLQAPGGR